MLEPCPFTPKSFVLSPNLPDFVFQINSQTYRCYSYQISAYSKVIMGQLKQDPTHLSYCFEDLNDPNFIFPNFLKLLQGQNIDINPRNAYFYHAIAFELQIDPLIQVTEKFVNVPITIDNFFSIVRIQANIMRVDKAVIDFAIQHWNEIYCTSEFADLPYAAIEAIMNDDDFDCDIDESRLFAWICSLVQRRGPKFANLCQITIFRELTCDEMEYFLDTMISDEISAELWEAMKYRLPEQLKDLEEEEEEDQADQDMTEQPLIPLPSAHTARSMSTPTPQQANTPKIVALTGRYTEPATFEGGIVHGFKTQDKQNWKRFVVLTGGGTKERHRYNIFEYSEPDSFWDNYNGKTCTAAEAWICVTFPSHTLQLTSYILGSSTLFTNNTPRSWVVEASSNKGETWFQIDQEVNVAQMNVKSPLVRFNLKTPTQPINAIRIILQMNWGTKSSQKHEFNCSCLELFGKLAYSK